MTDMYIVNHGDVINGKLGTAFLKINGKNVPVSWLKDIEAVMEKNKVSFPVLGQTAKRTRSSGWEGKGKATMYYATSILREMALKYAKTGEDTYVDLVVTNDDPMSVLGQQAVLLKNVNFDSIVLAKLDIANDDPLDETVDFTFDDFEMISSFTHPQIPGGLVFAE